MRQKENIITFKREPIPAIKKITIKGSTSAKPFFNRTLRLGNLSQKEKLSFSPSKASQEIFKSLRSD